jgi:hypothetical protein
MIAAAGGRGLSDAAILAAWEAGLAGPPLDRAHAILWYALSEPERAALDAWTPGRRDAWLLDVYAATFGPHIAGLVACPACGEQLEIVLESDAIRSPSGDADEAIELTSAEADYRVVFHLPSIADLRLSTASGDEDRARGTLLERCVLAVQRGGEALEASDLPAEIVNRIEEVMSERDAQADIRLAMICPTCEHAWQARFDVADFIWREVSARARHLINDMHTIALAYGWRDADILALSAARRQMHLDLILG